MHTKNVIYFSQADTIPALFMERVKRNQAEGIAYWIHQPSTRQWHSLSWQAVHDAAARWQQAFLREGLQPGDRVAIMLKNSLDWVLFDLAALGLGLVTVPLYVNDRPGNVAHILRETNTRLLLLSTANQWQQLQDMQLDAPDLKRVLSQQPNEHSDVMALEDWLGTEDDTSTPVSYQNLQTDTDALATIVYTSGTSGLAKGVKLSHRNILSDASAVLEIIDAYEEDKFLSVLPLSHMLERTAGYYIPMMIGASVAHARGIETLAHDLKQVCPTVLIAVPRLFERFYRKVADSLNQQPRKRWLFNLAIKAGWRQFMYQQGEQRWHPLCLLAPVLVPKVNQAVMQAFGGKLRLAVSGGAALANELAEVFCSLGLDLLQGYGLTECSPVVAVNHLDTNHPHSVGKPLPHLQIKFGDNQELLIKGDSVMLGYWKHDDASAAIFDEEGWLRTGDLARLDHKGRLHIMGRAKDIMVLSNGENIAPSDLEQSMALDPVVEQVMVYGDGKAFVTALIVVNPDHWKTLCKDEGWDASLINSPTQEMRSKLARRLNSHLNAVPGFAKVKQVILTDVMWSVDNQCLTPTLKLRREQIIARFEPQLNQLYRALLG
ncbi:hypothetical protein WH50_20900 [Pokkaliibacter plantistimulans]|uniref:AMP-dependent synthetase/ligase domain-containing protein n=1 Tax=Pokkaliibacter plantistimulans TaxID=1635171 RepID=A0ABX5LUZ2_9GAMM|nr:AMP-dependent synthetase/ligase [Pokkaliibacter plantistimulans]PXF29420.1 hypothetical protein WH50_20900 [Pokkaliibacter plantistimulans]